jgi:hypothetical protein
MYVPLFSPSVHIPAHLIEYEPVPDGAVLCVVLHVPHVCVRLEVSADPHLHHVVAHRLGADLDDAVEEADHGEAGKEKVPEPQHEEYLKKSIRQDNISSSNTHIYIYIYIYIYI